MDRSYSHTDAVHQTTMTAAALYRLLPTAGRNRPQADGLPHRRRRHSRRNPRPAQRQRLSTSLARHAELQIDRPEKLTREKVAAYPRRRAHESRSATVRLNTGAPGVESRSTLKYPCRRNWKRSPGCASTSDGSTLAVIVRSESGLRLSVNSPPSGRSLGSSFRNRWSYMWTSASRQCSADTQCDVPRTRRPSADVPPRVSGS